jgi:hypothetical protein
MKARRYVTNAPIDESLADQNALPASETSVGGIVRHSTLHPALNENLLTSQLVANERLGFPQLQEHRLRRALRRDFLSVEAQDDALTSRRGDQLGDVDHASLHRRSLMAPSVVS